MDKWDQITRIPSIPPTSHGTSGRAVPMRQDHLTDTAYKPKEHSPFPSSCCTFPLSPNPKISPELTHPPYRVTFLLNLLLGIWSLIPTAAQRAANKYGLDDMQSKHSPTSDHSDREWEMKRVKVQATPAQPYTPRTLAFNTLDRQLPLRAAADKGRWS
jgi:hypothetical protein